MYIHMYVYIYIYTYIHTYICTYNLQYTLYNHRMSCYITLCYIRLVSYQAASGEGTTPGGADVRDVELTTPRLRQPNKPQSSLV